jgi:peptidyl-prolyl cis-trans isomerase A (cyclophilin A)
MRGLLKFLLVFAPALLVTSASALTITAQPKATTVNAGSTATFKVVTTNGTPAAYQWFLGTSALQDGTASSGAIISGSQTATLTVENVPTSLNSSSFKVVVSTGGAPLNSLMARLSVLQGTLVKFDVPGAGTMVVELFDHDKPESVQNFLRYVQSGYSGYTNFYANTFFSRLEPNFVLQGGGFAPYPFAPDNLFTNVYSIADSALSTLNAVGLGLLWYVRNEANIGPHVRNTFGTLAMATPDGFPNRGRSEWYFNLADNTAGTNNLDTANGGYAVFGRVVQGLDALTAFNQLSPSQIISRTVTRQVSATDYATNTFPTVPVKTTDANNVHVSDIYLINISLLSKPSLDLIKPSIRITYPPANATLTNGTITLRGTATDNLAINGVYPQNLFYGAVGPDFLDNDEVFVNHVNIVGTTNWSADVDLHPGPWKFIVTVYDGHGNWSQAVETFTVLSPLAVTTNGSGTISPNLNGKWLSPESRYTMTARAGRGQLFAYWTGVRNGQTWIFPYDDRTWSFIGTNNFKSGPQQGPKVTTPTLTFTMYTNLTITANFVSNYFPVVQGTYYGLVAPSDRNDMNVSNAGLCKISSTSVGSFSGTLSMLGKTFPFSGKWDYAGNATGVVISRPGIGNLTANLSIDLSNNLGKITGTVTGTNVAAILDASRNVTRLTSTTVPAPRNYVMIFPTQSTNSDLGDSFATVAVSSAGTISIKGLMSDNTSWSESVGVGQSGNFPLFASLYSGHGLIIGLQEFADNSVARWIRPAISNAYYAKAFTTDEFINELHPYVRPTANSTYTLRFGGDTLTEVDYSVHATATGQLVVSGGTGKLPSLVVTATTGAISGTWTDSANGKWTLKGIFQDPTAGGTGFILGPHGQTGYLHIDPTP